MNEISNAFPLSPLDDMFRHTLFFLGMDHSTLHTNFVWFYYFWSVWWNVDAAVHFLYLMVQGYLFRVYNFLHSSKVSILDVYLHFMTTTVFF